MDSKERSRKWRESHREAKALYNKKYSAQHREATALYRKKYNARHREVLRARRASWEPHLSLVASRCARCGGFRGEVAMHLHHLDPETKLFGVGEAMSARSFPDANILLEIERCVPLCRGCHLAVHKQIRAGIHYFEIEETFIYRREEVLSYQEGA